MCCVSVRWVKSNGDTLVFSPLPSRLGGEGDILLIDGGSRSSPPTSSTYFSPSVTSSPARHTSRCPAPLKDKNSFEAIFITTAPKIKKQQKHLYDFLHWPSSPADPLPSPPPCCLHPLWYSLHVFSPTAVYINQYIYQTAAAYCVCRFERAKDTEGVSLLWI